MVLSNEEKENIKNLLRRIFSPKIKQINAKLIFDSRFHDDIERHFHVTEKLEIITKLEKLRVLIENIFVPSDFGRKVEVDYQIQGKDIYVRELVKGHWLQYSIYTQKSKQIYRFISCWSKNKHTNI